MKSRHSRHIPSKGMVSGFGSAFAVMGTLLILPQTASAEVRTIKMPEQMCEVLREEPLNQKILEQVRNRADFARVVQYVEENCEELGGLLIGPTGSIAGAPGGGGSSPEGGNGPALPVGCGDGRCDDEGDGVEPTFPGETLESTDESTDAPA